MIDTTVNNFYRDEILENVQSPVYQITAVDLAGNISLPSDSESANLIVITQVSGLVPVPAQLVKINSTETVSISCQVYSPGVTNLLGQGAGILGQVWLSKKGSFKTENGEYEQESEGYLFGVPTNWPGYNSYIAQVDAKFDSIDSNLLGIAFQFIDENNFYLLDWNEGKIEIKKVIGGSSSINLRIPATSYSFPSLSNTWITLKLKVAGSNFYAKAWRKGGPEPLDWQIFGKDDSLSSGAFALATYNARVSFDNLKVIKLDSVVSNFVVSSQEEWQTGETKTNVNISVYPGKMVMDLYVYGKATADNYLAGYPPSNANDGNDGTAWHVGAASAGNPHWIEIQFSNPKTIQKAGWKVQSGYNPKFFGPDDFSIQYYAGEQWNIAKSVTGWATTQGNWESELDTKGLSSSMVSHKSLDI